MNAITEIFSLAPEVAGTLTIIVAVVLANLAITAILRNRSWLSRETKLRASVFWRNFSFVIALVSLIFVWRAELRVAALSLAALSVAVVVAGKELLTSILGYVHRTTSVSFEFGDIIEINAVRGQVIDQTLLSTTLLEMSEEHQFTGRTVQFPNSFYVTHAMKNHSRIGSYQLGMLTVPLAAGVDAETQADALKKIADSVCSDYVAPTGSALRALEGEQFVVMPTPEPRVTVRMAEGGKALLLLRYPCPADQRTRVEQEILLTYLKSSATRTTY